MDIFKEPKQTRISKLNAWAFAVAVLDISIKDFFNGLDDYTKGGRQITETMKELGVRQDKLVSFNEKCERIYTDSLSIGAEMVNKLDNGYSRLRLSVGCGGGIRLDYEEERGETRESLTVFNIKSIRNMSDRDIEGIDRELKLHKPGWGIYGDMQKLTFMLADNIVKARKELEK